MEVGLVREVGQKSTLLVPGWNNAKLENSVKIPIISFFTGAGFLDLGFELEGFEGVWHNEFNSHFIDGFQYGMSKALNRNFKIEYNGSISDADSNLIVKKAFGGKVGSPDLFGVIGGPPCPDFSVGGKNKGHFGDNGRLSEVYVERILEISPTFFVFENVKGLYKTAKHRSFLDRLINKLEQVGGYRIDHRLLNALEFGVPQDRERVFIIGFKNDWLKKREVKIDIGQRNWYPWPEDSRYVGAKNKYDWPEVSPFGSNIPKPRNIPKELMVWSVLENQEELLKMPNGSDFFKPYSEKFYQIMEGDTSRKSFKRLHRWRFSPTAAYGNNEVHLHPVLPRRLSVREAMRIQSAPDHYELPAEMPLSHKFKTIGNAVPVNMARALAISLKSFLQKYL